MEKSERPVLVATLLAMVALIALSAVVPDASSRDGWYAERVDATTVSAPTGPTATTTGTPGPEPTQAPAEQSAPDPAQGPTATLPDGSTSIFGGGKFLVAYYGTAQTAGLGVLGEDPPERMFQRLTSAAAPFQRRKQPVQPVFELIVSIADGYAGKGGDFSHDIPRAEVQKYIDAAHEHGALLLLDLQTGRSDFLTVAKRWAWALKDPYVGLALDPEWRMGKKGVPGQRIGSVGAAEVNRVSAWLRDLTAANALPQKLFVLHQFRTDMIRDITQIKPRKGLVMVQHVDGFGTPGQKLDTFHAVAKPRQFFMGFKLFYDEDVRRMSAADVHRVRPKVRFVSFQ